MENPEPPQQHDDPFEAEREARRATEPDYQAGGSGYLHSLQRRRHQGGLLNELTDDMLFGRYSVEADALFLTDREGFVLTAEEFEGMVQELRKFYACVPDEMVRAHNRARWTKIYDPPPQVKSSPRPTHQRKPQRGFVYLIEGGGHYKIGKAIDPRKRSEQLTIQLPYPVNLLHVVESDDYSRLERKLHQRFAPQRENGEWFDLEDSDVEHILAMRRVLFHEAGGVRIEFEDFAAEAG